MERDKITGLNKKLAKLSDKEAKKQNETKDYILAENSGQTGKLEPYFWP
jgi:hypothetical protein